MSRLSGRRLLVTSGSTRGPIDRVRFITNRSTGKLGATLAEKAMARGAEVIYLHGRGSAIPDPFQGEALLKVRDIETVAEALEAAMEILRDRPPDAIIHSMAVLDYEPADFTDRKVRSGDEEWLIRLVPTPKIISAIREVAPETVLVSFKLEVAKSEDELLEIGRAHLRSSGSDFVLVNDLAEIERGRHLGVLLGRNGEVVARVEGKPAIAEAILDAVERQLLRKEGG